VLKQKYTAKDFSCHDETRLRGLYRDGRENNNKLLFKLFIKLFPEPSVTDNNKTDYLCKSTVLVG